MSPLRWTRRKSPGPDELDSLVARRHEHQRHTVTPREGVIEALREIRDSGYSIGILTDCTPELVTLWPSLPYTGVVDAVTFSCEVGHRKPHPAGYADIVAKLGVLTEEWVYVGDGGSGELTGAAKVGMTPVLVETPLDASFRYDPEVAWAGRSISEISELSQLLRDGIA